MKKRIFVSVVILLLLAAFVWAGTTNFDAVVVTPNAADDTYGLRLNNSSGTRLFSVDASGNVYTSGTVTAATTRSVPLPILGFLVGITNTELAPLSTNVDASGAYASFANAVPFISFARSRTTPVIVTFRVPDDYSTGGYFRVFASQWVTTPVAAVTIDFDVFVNAAASGVTTAATNQTPVALDYANSTQPSSVILTPGTDFASLAGGQWVTLRIWRGTTGGGSVLAVKDVAFIYTATR
jgi:hypothetical protein